MVLEREHASIADDQKARLPPDAGLVARPGAGLVDVATSDVDGVRVPGFELVRRSFASCDVGHWNAAPSPRGNAGREPCAPSAAANYMRHPAASPRGRKASVVVEALLDELLLDLLTVGVEARILEVLLELEVHRVVP